MYISVKEGKTTISYLCDELGVLVDAAVRWCRKPFSLTSPCGQITKVLSR